ncbi:unnamed protein product, partial [Nesidiocoris tenuis]
SMPCNIENQQLPEYHVIILLNVLEVTAHEKSGLNEDTITKLIDFSIAEIQRTDLTQNVHSLASEILVVLGSKHCSKVKKALVKTIVALCCKGHALDGSDFVEYLVRHCAVLPTQSECARAVGILATAHLDMVLNRLENIAQTELNKRNSRLLGLMKDSRAEAENPSTFNQCGDLIGSLVVRYFDSQESIGKIAASCMGILLAIANVYDGHGHDPKTEKLFESLPEENTAMCIAECLAVQASTGGSSILIDALVTNLLAAYNTPLSTVRAIALRGLSYIADLPPEQACKTTLKQISTVMDAPKVSDLIQKHMLHNGVLQFEPFASVLIDAVVRIENISV